MNRIIVDKVGETHEFFRSPEALATNQHRLRANSLMMSDWNHRPSRYSCSSRWWTNRVSRRPNSGTSGKARPDRTWSCRSARSHASGPRTGTRSRTFRIYEWVCRPGPFRGSTRRLGSWMLFGRRKCLLGIRGTLVGMWCTSRRRVGRACNRCGCECIRDLLVDRVARI